MTLTIEPINTNCGFVYDIYDENGVMISCMLTLKMAEKFVSLPREEQIKMDKEIFDAVMNQ